MTVGVHALAHVHPRDIHLAGGEIPTAPSSNYRIQSSTPTSSGICTETRSPSTPPSRRPRRLPMLHPTPTTSFSSEITAASTKSSKRGCC
ncbi:hypothetical protein HPP92_019521 [Vanilla planifolia]|uniref:Uncharacterized protein n=1 Tax=Vanilla planifolia TaxID=51239 RepID=A0A835Q8Z6_VANPL|nr:hypothetical protein HPP92_019521 [Vanilla planifolia]